MWRRKQTDIIESHLLHTLQSGAGFPFESCAERVCRWRRWWRDAVVASRRRQRWEGDSNCYCCGKDRRVEDDRWVSGTLSLSLPLFLSLCAYPADCLPPRCLAAHHTRPDQLCSAWPKNTRFGKVARRHSHDLSFVWTHLIRPRMDNAHCCTAGLIISWGSNLWHWSIWNTLLPHHHYIPKALVENTHGFKGIFYGSVDGLSSFLVY